MNSAASTPAAISVSQTVRAAEQQRSRSASSSAARPLTLTPPLPVSTVMERSCSSGTQTTTRPRASNEETVVVFMVDGYADYEPLAPIAQDMLEQTQAFDDTLKEVEFQTLMYDDATQSMPSEMLKCAMIVISALPIICVYPFLQKYFVKGIMVGSLKG